MVSINLPWDLIEEILCRVHPLSLVRFKTVCKKWNSLFGDKKFVEKHLVLSRPQFIFKFDSNIYSVAIDFRGPRIDVHKLTLFTPNDELITGTRFNALMRFNYVDCDGLLFCNKDVRELLIWNPWLRETRMLPSENYFGWRYFIGYDNNKQYKLYDHCISPNQISKIGVVTKKWKASGIHDDPMGSGIVSNVVSFSGTLNWAFKVYDNYNILIRNFSFSTEKLTTIGRVPFEYNYEDCLVLAVFKKTRLSLLNLCNRTSNITIWLTKNNIITLEEDMVWIKLMTVLIPNFPKMSFVRRRNPHLAYFLDNEDAKRFVICCWDETERHPYIYIIKGDTFKKIEMDNFDGSYVDWNLNTYIPSLVSPSQINENNKE